ncbi:spore coat protein, CotS family [Paenibacillus sophorae]|uniref:CotS family spore coat protein n=1 Tax=Paenibacillus sophorae TaxID=1333845 RepID=A0A1H8M101_9BACL|nr:CotS family spore coat protein [Paenibacillus sophorae]QWU17628.1 CotS family spore coat protein [Paenibacillus sophorae]SEO10989.1 spore coat protein, CotS family [Paenibacillus sophorae]
MFHQLLQAASEQYGIVFYESEILHKTGRTLVLALKSPQGDYILKSIFTSETRLQFILEAEYFLRLRGIHIPEIFPTLTGTRYFLWEGDRYVLQEKLRGTPFPPTTIEAVTRRAALLGRMHSSSLGFLSNHGPYGPEERLWLSTYLRELSSLKHWVHWYQNSRASKKKMILSHIDFFQQTGRELVERLERHAFFKSWIDAPLQKHFLCHGDFHSENVLTVGSSLYIIDFEFIRYDYPSKDIARFLQGIMNRRKGWDPVWFDHLLNAYLRENPLNDDQLDLMYFDLAFPHSFYRFVDKGGYRNMSLDDVAAYLQREYDKTVYFLQQTKR